MNSSKKKLFIALVLSNIFPVKYFFPLLISSFLLLIPVVHAGECDDPQAFSCYTKRITEQCTTSKPNSWDGKNMIFANGVRKPYVEYSVANLRKQQAAILAEPSQLPSDDIQKTKLSQETSDPFTSVKQARLQYQRNMNTIFSCAITGARLKHISALQELIKKTSGKNSGMEEKLKQESEKLEKLKASLKCGGDGTNADTELRLMNTAMTEYCTYSFYLDYLESNIRYDFSRAASIEKELKGTGALTTKTIIDATKMMNSYVGTIQNEKSRAKSTLPKALVAYREMNRTYSIHLLLVIIYDDYRQLRDNLNSYLSAISQLFEKANNAQDSNK